MRGKGTKEGIKIRKPTVKDVEAIFKLNNDMADRGLMLHRSKYKIIEMLGNFLVAENDDGKIVGCGAFSLLWTDLGEINALAVDRAYQGKGIGTALVRALLEKGRELKVPEVITLTYRKEFFERLGFKETDKNKFPKKIWRECLECPKLENCDEIALHLYL